MTMRWKKEPRETGLRAVGARPRSSNFHDGVTEYATVSPLGGGWSKPPSGWYFYGTVNGESMNTCNSPAETEAEAKAQASAWVKAAMAKEKAE